MKQILKKIISAVVCGSLLLSLAACGGNKNTSQESTTSDEILVEITNNNGEIENITGQELRDISEENGVMFDNLYKEAPVRVIGTVEKVQGNIDYLGHFMEGYVVLKGGWLVEVSSTDLVENLRSGDKVEITGNIFSANHQYIDIWIVNGNTTNIKPYNQ